MICIRFSRFRSGISIAKMTLSRMECTKLAQEMQSCHYWLVLQRLALVVTTLYTTANPLPTSEAPLMRFVWQTSASNQSLGWPSKPPGAISHTSIRDLAEALWSPFVAKTDKSDSWVGGAS